MGNWGIRERPARWRLVGVLAALAVHMKQVLRLRIVGLELSVFERPRRRNAVLMTDLIEIAFAQTKQRGTIHLGIAAAKIMQAGTKALAISVVPRLLGLIGAVDEHSLRIPVGGRAREEIPAFEQ
jgi:hypothetical protein